MLRDSRHSVPPDGRTQFKYAVVLLKKKNLEWNMIKLPDPKNNLQKIERTEEYVKNAPTKSSLWET